jgi:hypothetical protein
MYTIVFLYFKSNCDVLSDYVVSKIFIYENPENLYWVIVTVHRYASLNLDNTM